ncbi:uncharacterized protein LOC113552937 [Rhopalosiphum maidis]|uniref:uncharacterized protein LOC113552937 n=1 Tax=Rhopalosiphum maidis TaxID=43146 RepID=UPI000EFED6BA|nr:uncharacterized protein LOC113552937 [Rhopalosiphum maidis]
MKRSIAVVVAGRGLTILWVFATAQVMCERAIDEDSEVYKAISENKEGLVTHMITTKGLEKASRQLHMSPLRVTDINPTVDDEDVTAAEEQPRNMHHQRLRPLMPTYVVPNEEIQYNTKTKNDGEPEVEMSQAINDLPEIGNVETMATRRDDESAFANDDEESKTFGDYTYRSNLVTERPKLRRVRSKKRTTMV